MKRLVLAVLVAAAFVPTPAAAAAQHKVAFSCDFSRELAKTWKLIGGNWQQRDGCLKQTDPGLDDPTKAVIVVGDAEELSTDVVITARLRLDAWKEGDYARAGVGVCADPTSGHGLNLVFHQGQLKFLQDHGCYEFQGYLFSRPMAASALTEMTRNTSPGAYTHRYARTIQAVATIIADPSTIPMSGESTMKATTLKMPVGMRPVWPRDGSVAPIIPPASAWEDDDGSPHHQVRRFQTIAPMSAENTTASTTCEP